LRPTLQGRKAPARPCGMAQIGLCFPKVRLQVQFAKIKAMAVGLGIDGNGSIEFWWRQD
jgi:hypothetical protein